MATREANSKPRNDAYTGLLAISFLALVGATVFMVLDAEEVGKAPPALKIDVPGMTPGKAGDPLRRPDTGKIDTTDVAPPPKAPMGPGTSKAEPNKLPALPAVAGGSVVPVNAEGPVGLDGPPLPVKPFVPPQQ
jgi:hypothetical protein